MKIKKLKRLYRVTTSYDSAVVNRELQVVAIDASQAIRKFKYNLTRSKHPLKEGEVIDEVIKIGIIEVK